ERMKAPPMKWSSLLVAASVAALSAPAFAQEPTPAPAGDTPAGPEKKDRGAFVAGAKAGIALPFDGLTPMASGVVEIGYVLPFLKRSFAILVDVGYTVPTKSGTVMGDPRVDGK